MNKSAIVRFVKMASVSSSRFSSNSTKGVKTLREFCTKYGFPYAPTYVDLQKPAPTDISLPLLTLMRLDGANGIVVHGCQHCGLVRYDEVGCLFAYNGCVAMGTPGNRYPLLNVHFLAPEGTAIDAFLNEVPETFSLDVRDDTYSETGTFLSVLSEL